MISINMNYNHIVQITLVTNEKIIYLNLKFIENSVEGGDIIREFHCLCYEGNTTVIKDIQSYESKLSLLITKDSYTL